MTLDLCRNFISAQYLENKWTGFGQTLYSNSRLALLAVIFCKFVAELWPLIDVRITFPLNILRNWAFFYMQSTAVGL